jgi:hypothetical protein
MPLNSCRRCEELSRQTSRRQRTAFDLSFLGSVAPLRSLKQKTGRCP